MSIEIAGLQKKARLFKGEIGTSTEAAETGMQQAFAIHIDAFTRRCWGRRTTNGTVGSKKAVA